MPIKHVTLYACNNAMGLSLGLTQDVFAFASLLQTKLLDCAIDISVVTLDGEAISSFSGLTVQADCALAEVPRTDLVILHGIWGELDELLKQQQPLFAQLREWHSLGVPIMAATTASFLLAEAGLLNDRISTTHWHKQKELAQRYPLVEVRPERFVTATGELYCSAGMNAAMEIMVHLLATMSCPEVAKKVEDTFLVDFKRGYSSDFISVGQQTYHQDDAILAVQQWLEIHFSEVLTLDQLAMRALMSLRTFKRRFKAATGVTPLNYIQQLRMEQGRELLKHSNKTIAEISWRVGYEDPGHFNRLFKRAYGKSPAQWRKEKSH